MRSASRSFLLAFRGIGAPLIEIHALQNTVNIISLRALSLTQQFTTLASDSKDDGGDGPSPPTSTARPPIDVDIKHRQEEEYQLLI